MRNKLVLRLGLGAGLLVAAAGAQAQQAVIDPETGELISGGVSDGPTPSVQAAQDFSPRFLGPASDPIRLQNGATAVQTGDESLVFLTVTIGQDGKPVFRHQTQEEIEAGMNAATNEGVQ
jgi:hypothetical protein